MKINEHGRVHSLQSYQKNAPGPKLGQANSRGSSHDELIISPEALKMAQEVRAKTDTPQRSEKVEQIKQAVRNGTYEIDARKIAEKMARHLFGE